MCGGWCPGGFPCSPLTTPPTALYPGCLGPSSSCTPSPVCLEDGADPSRGSRLARGHGRAQVTTLFCLCLWKAVRESQAPFSTPLACFCYCIGLTITYCCHLPCQAGISGPHFTDDEAERGCAWQCPWLRTQTQQFLATGSRGRDIARESGSSPHKAGVGWVWGTTGGPRGVEQCRRLHPSTRPC